VEIIVKFYGDITEHKTNNLTTCEFNPTNSKLEPYLDIEKLGLKGVTFSKMLMFLIFSKQYINPKVVLVILELYKDIEQT